uniref:Sterol regulatory element-binding protein cleavage-activating protein n=1 Tax=Ditylenchus dipsaci TaxID=166011 RepID=A0A915EI70_9BILA
MANLKDYLRGSLPERSWNVREKVARAFYDYGRLCSAHPATCLSISIITTLFLSWPAIAKVRLPISSPMDVYWSNGPSVDYDKNSSTPEWLKLKGSTAYVQNFIIRGVVEPWDSANKNLSPTVAVKGPLSRAFVVENIVRTDNNILSTIFAQPCTANVCLRDVFLGTPTRFTGIKEKYRTNRKRYIEFAITLFTTRFDSSWRSSLISALSQHFEIKKSRASDDQTFVHVYYVPRKYFADYAPLLTSYLICAVMVFYFTVCKFEMVKSKMALAFGAFITVLTTLSSTAGICSYFELTPTLWGAGLYPYLAMVITLENILCITRSVVYTPPSMSVSSRLSYGLSAEGCSISKYFLLEMCFLFLGYITFVPEIQEFCSFAFIGLVVDLYMQLFFYAPCLTYDLLRLGTEEKQKFSLMLFNTDIKKLKNYPNPTCPARILLPSLFINRRRLVRTYSDTQMSTKYNNTMHPRISKSHRRTLSTEKIEIYLKRETLISNRLRLLYYWTKTRFFQRLLMIFFCFWVLWLAFIVHKWRLFDVGVTSQNTTLKASEKFGISQHLIETAPLEWGEFQRNTFRWWPAFLSQYNNISLSGNYITFVPPIFIEALVPVDDPRKHLNAIRDSANGSASPAVELNNRIYWLERQMTAMLLFSTLLPFSIVVIFILYMCFWDRWFNLSDSKQITSATKKRASQPITTKVLIWPLFFFHAMICLLNVCGRILVWDPNSGELKHTLKHPHTSGSSSNQNLNLAFLPAPQQQLRQRSRTLSNAVNNQPGDASSSSNLLSVQKLEVAEGSDHFPSSRYIRSQVWCMDMRQNVVVMGYSSGFIDIFHSLTGNYLGGTQEGETNVTASAGITHIQIKSNRVISMKLNGSLESHELMLFYSDKMTPIKASIQRLTLTRAHQKPATQMICTSNYVISCGHDTTIKVFDIVSMRVLFTLNGHDSSVVSICADEQANTLFSCSLGGAIFCWDLEDGCLLRTVDSGVNEVDIYLFDQAHEIKCTSELLVALNVGTSISFFNKFSGQLLAQILLGFENNKYRRGEEYVHEEGQHLIIFNDQLAISSNGNSLQLWDLNDKVLIRQICLPSQVDKISQVNAQSLLCCSGSHIYIVSLPGVYKDN